MAGKWIRLYGAVLASAAVVGVVAPASAEPVDDADGVDRPAIDRYVADYAARAGYPGVAVAITKDGRVLHTSGCGHDSTGTAVTASTPMPVASVSKSFTALAVLQLVEVVTGERFGAYLRDQVLRPAGMRHTTTAALTPRDLPPSVAKGHIHAYGASIPATEPLRFVDGSDGVISTAGDMARWLIVQSTGGRTADGTRLVSPASVTAMHSPSDPRWTYGMGWEAGDGRVRHAGIWFTYAAGVQLTESGYGVAVLSDSGVALGNEGTAELEDGIAAILDGQAPPEPPSTRLIIDLVLAGLTVLSVALAVRAVRRNRLGRHGTPPGPPAWWSSGSCPG